VEVGEIMENTEWLDKLKSQIVEAKDKENFVDLIKCYQNNLLRAGFVMAWLMLVAKNGRYPPTQNGDIRSLF
jgi:hypothetical protein